MDANESDAKIERSTIIGNSRFRSLEASDSIFTETINVEDRQKGCVRFCYIPFGSIRPRSFRCQPDLALEKEAALSPTKPLPQGEKDRILARVRPLFTGASYSDPAYCQLSQASAEEIRTGAENGSEMGVYCTLQQPQREANLRAALDEYLRLGLEAGIFFVT